VGRIMADLITTGATDMPIAPFRIDRFSDANIASIPSKKEQGE
jgi:sarcosine oxidase subunit beta